MEEYLIRVRPPGAARYLYLAPGGTLCRGKADAGVYLGPTAAVSRMATEAFQRPGAVVLAVGRHSGRRLGRALIEVVSVAVTEESR